MNNLVFKLNFLWYFTDAKNQIANKYLWLVGGCLNKELIKQICPLETSTCSNNNFLIKNSSEKDF